MQQAKRTKVVTAGAASLDAKVRLTIPWRKLLLLCLGLGLVSGFYWGGAGISEAFDQPLKEVRIQGDFEHLNVEAVKRMVQARVDEGLLAADLLEIQQLLLDEPWVEQVAVRRKWPDLLQVDLVERSPVVRWNQNELLTSKAEAFKPKENLERYQLPRLVGEDGSRAEILQQYRWLSQQLKADGLLVSELEKEPRGAWRLKLAQGFSVELGKGNLLEKIMRFKGIYSAALHQKLAMIEKVDLRYTHGAAVRWKEEKNAEELVSEALQGSASQASTSSMQFNNGSKV